jgi:hypothetical protein
LLHSKDHYLANKCIFPKEPGSISLFSACLFDSLPWLSCYAIQHEAQRALPLRIYIYVILSQTSHFSTRSASHSFPLYMFDISIPFYLPLLYYILLLFLFFSSCLAFDSKAIMLSCPGRASQYTPQPHVVQSIDTPISISSLRSLLVLLLQVASSTRPSLRQCSLHDRKAALWFGIYGLYLVFRRHDLPGPSLSTAVNHHSRWIASTADCLRSLLYPKTTPRTMWVIHGMFLTRLSTTSKHRVQRFAVSP